MSLDLSFGGGVVPEPGSSDWFAELAAVLIAHDRPAHAEPEVALQVWSVKRRVTPLVEAADRFPGWSLLGRFSLADSAFVPQAFDGVLETPEGFTVGSLPTLTSELVTLEARLRGAGEGEEDPQLEAVMTFRFAAERAAAAGAALWLR